MCSQCEVVVLLTREARQVEDDDELYPAFVKAAELQQLLKLRAVGGLRALAFLAESSKDFEALTLAVFLAGLELRRQTQILSLLFRADTDVGDSSDHLRQLRPVRRCSQARRPHVLQSRRPILEECVDHDMRHRLGVPADLIDLFVGQSDGFIAKQLATAIDRNLVCVEKRRVDLFHRRPHSRVELLGVRALSASADLTDALVHRRGCGPDADIDRERLTSRSGGHDSTTVRPPTWSCHQRRS